MHLGIFKINIFLLEKGVETHFSVQHHFLFFCGGSSLYWISTKLNYLDAIIAQVVETIMHFDFYFLLQYKL